VPKDRWASSSHTGSMSFPGGREGGGEVDAYRNKAGGKKTRKKPDEKVPAGLPWAAEWERMRPNFSHPRGDQPRKTTQGG